MSDERGSDQADSPPQAQAAGAEDRTVMESGPRRVILRRDSEGCYQILMRSRQLQGFCREFEDVTGFAIAPDMQLQVRINIQQIGGLHRATYPDREPESVINADSDQPILRARLAEEDREVALFSTVHPGNPTVTMTWQDEAREQLVREIEERQNMIDLLARM